MILPVNIVDSMRLLFFKTSEIAFLLSSLAAIIDAVDMYFSLSNAVCIISAHLPMNLFANRV